MLSHSPEVYFVPMSTTNIATYVGEFNLSKPQRVNSGPGKIEALGAELEKRGLQRAIVVTGKTLGASPLLEKVTSAMGSRCASVWKGARQPVPRRTVDAL